MRKCQVTMEAVLGISLLVFLLVIGIGLWARMNQDMVGYVRWYEKERLEWAKDPWSLPQSGLIQDFSDLGNVIEQLNSMIVDLEEQRDDLIDEASTARQTARTVRRSGDGAHIAGIQHYYTWRWIGLRPRITGGVYYYRNETIQMARASTMEAVFKEDAALLIDEKAVEVAESRDKYIQIRDFLVAGNQAAAEAILQEMRDAQPTKEEALQEEIDKLKARAAQLDREAQALVAQAGDHWHGSNNTWSWVVVFGDDVQTQENQRVCWQEALDDEEKYEEAEARSTGWINADGSVMLIDPHRDGPNPPHDESTGTIGLAQHKRMQTQDFETNGLPGSGQSYTDILSPAQLQALEQQIRNGDALIDILQ